MCAAFHLCVLFYCIAGSWVVSNVNAFTNLPTLLLFKCFLCMWCILSARVLLKGNTTHLNCFSFAAFPLMIPVEMFFQISETFVSMSEACMYRDFHIVSSKGILGQMVIKIQCCILKPFPCTQQSMKCWKMYF